MTFAIWAVITGALLTTMALSGSLLKRLPLSTAMLAFTTVAARAAWFGIRGIASICYLMYAINHALPRPLAEQIIAITLTTVTVSIVLHGISVTPLMDLYARRKARRSRR